MAITGKAKIESVEWCEMIRIRFVRLRTGREDGLLRDL